jgi:sigma-B regulation protein RsbU (phosphoserine phosphatase)
MPYKVLIVDDNADMRELFRDYLAMQGFVIAEAENGALGVEKAKSWQPDLILMDIVMPEMNGYEACAELKLSAAFTDVPIIFLSSLTDTDQKITGFNAGAADYFPKSGDPLELNARIKTHLKLRALTISLREANRQLKEKQTLLDEDLSSAADIQRSLLPMHEYLYVPPVEIAWKYIACNFVGGDAFNVFSLSEDLLAIYMLDVAGHGVPSAMGTVSVCQHLQELINQLQIKSQSHKNKSQVLFSPSQLLIDLDREYPFKRFEKFFTIVYMTLDLKSGLLKYSLAGHPPAVLLHKDKPFELLSAGGAIIGMDGCVPFDEGSINLTAGDKIVLYTDGIYEFANDQGELFGTERFYDILENMKNDSTTTLTETVINALKLFGGQASIKDDLSLMAISYNPQ